MAHIYVSPKQLPRPYVVVEWTAFTACAVVTTWSAEERAAKRRIIEVRAVQDHLATPLPAFRAQFAALTEAEYAQANAQIKSGTISLITTDVQASLESPLQLDVPCITAIDLLKMVEIMIGREMDDGDRRRIRLTFQTLASFGVESGTPLHDQVMLYPPPLPRIKRVTRMYPWAQLEDALAGLVEKWFYMADPVTKVPIALPISLHTELTQMEGKTKAERKKAMRVAAGLPETGSPTSLPASSPRTPVGPMQTLMSPHGIRPLPVAPLPPPSAPSSNTRPSNSATNYSENAQSSQRIAKPPVPAPLRITIKSPQMQSQLPSPTENAAPSYGPASALDISTSNERTRIGNSQSPPLNAIHKRPLRIVHAPKRPRYDDEGESESESGSEGDRRHRDKLARQRNGEEEFEFEEELPLPPTITLEAFLNNQNPGLGFTCAPFLAKFGITTCAQLSRFRTVDWFHEFFETRLYGAGLTSIDEFLLKKVISGYLTS